MNLIYQINLKIFELNFLWRIQKYSIKLFMENSEILNLLSWYLPKKSKNILRLVSKTTRKYVLTDCLCNYECKLNCKCKCEICNSKLCF